MYFYHPVTRDESQSQIEVAEICCWIDHQEGRVYDGVREKVERRETGWEDMQEVFQLSCSWGDLELLFTTCPDAVLMCSYGYSVYAFGLCLVEFCWGAI